MKITWINVVTRSRLRRELKKFMTTDGQFFICIKPQLFQDPKISRQVNSGNEKDLRDFISYSIKWSYHVSESQKKMMLQEKSNIVGCYR